MEGTQVNKPQKHAGENVNTSPSGQHFGGNNNNINNNNPSYVLGTILSTFIC